MKEEEDEREAREALPRDSPTACTLSSTLCPGVYQKESVSPLCLFTFIYIVYSLTKVQMA